VRTCLVMARSALIVLIGVLWLDTGSLAAAEPAPVPQGDAGAFVVGAIYDGIKILSDPGLSEAQRRQAFGAFIAEKVDIPRIAQFALGHHWSSATAAERQQFVAAYAQYLSEAYATRLSQFIGAIATVTGTRRTDDEIYVKTRITFPGPLPRTATAARWEIGWVVAVTRQSFKIEDVDFQGVSLRVSQRQGLASLMAEAGGSIIGLIQALLSQIGQAAP
jgi:phospholipid transport system substrate-binding protein